MKPNFHHLEQYRIRTGAVASPPGSRFGGFFIPTDKGNVTVAVIASTDGEWDHVSAHLQIRNGKNYRDATPSWDIMCYIKELFFDPEEEAFQFHPKHSEYVNCHPHTLHIWRPQNGEINPPPRIFV